MTDPILTQEKLAAIRERSKHADSGDRFAIPRSAWDVPALLAHIDALAAKLALAEADRDGYRGMYRNSDKALTEAYSEKRGLTDLEKLLVTWRYWDKQTQAAEGKENWAEFHDQFLAYDRELVDTADRLAAKEAEA